MATVPSVSPNLFFYATDADKGHVRGLPIVTNATNECAGFGTFNMPFSFVGIHAAIEVLVACSAGSSALERKSLLGRRSLRVCCPDSSLWHNFCPLTLGRHPQSGVNADVACQSNQVCGNDCGGDLYKEES